MSSTKVDWEKNIAGAMTEVDGRQRAAKRGITLPNWIPYLASVVFGLLLGDMFLNDRSVHPVNENRDYALGGRAAMLMVAEDVQSYWDANGSLPAVAPGSLADVLQISYEKLDSGHFRLRMLHDSGEIVFDGAERSMTLR
jgi:hypothetical protein